MLLDVLVPYYGRADYLRAAVDSVLAQDSEDFRLTVVDDADPRGEAGDYLRAVHDTRLRYLRNDHNLGLNRNFQRCLDLVEAPYCVFMGCDDLMLAGYVETVLRAIGSGGWEILQPGVRVVDELGVEVLPLADRTKRWLRPRPGTYAGQAAAARLCVGDWLYFPSVCWRTDVVKPIGFAPGLRVALDLTLILQVLMQGGRLRVEPDVVFAYRRHLSSESSPAAEHGDRFREEAVVHEQARQQFAALGWRRARAAARARPTSRLHAVLGATRLARAGDLAAARDVMSVAAGR